MESSKKKVTPLNALHHDLKGHMVLFAGYEMPVSFPEGIIKEHLHTRSAAGLFDVSHMGQVLVQGERATEELEALMPADLKDLAELNSTYSLLMNDNGGVRDDLIVTRLSDTQFMVVVNAACKETDIEVLKDNCPNSEVTLQSERALLALQGPKARDVIRQFAPNAATLKFMTATESTIADTVCFITCSGYTGEDGFEISLPNDKASEVARLLLEHADVAPIGLGARDSLRLEAGLSLYGHELSTDITPVEAGLRWAIAKARRPDGKRAGGYPGSDVIAKQLAEGTSRIRVGLKIQGKRPVREGQIIQNQQGENIGEITSGGVGSTVGSPVALGFVTPEYAAIDTEVVISRGSAMINAQVVRLPMTPPGYYRG